MEEVEGYYGEESEDGKCVCCYCHEEVIYGTIEYDIMLEKMGQSDYLCAECRTEE